MKSRTLKHFIDRSKDMGCLDFLDNVWWELKNS